MEQSFRGRGLCVFIAAGTGTGVGVVCLYQRGRASVPEECQQGYPSRGGCGCRGGGSVSVCVCVGVGGVRTWAPSCAPASAGCEITWVCD